MGNLKMKQQEIRAVYDKNTITVYQAYNKNIAVPASEKNRFVSSFSFNRMTWIKPSFLWLMERSNWGTKTNQEYILGIKIKRELWENALSMGVLTHPDRRIYPNGLIWQQSFKNSRVHIQWDPERNLRVGKLQQRTIQVGISQFLIEEYNEKGITEIVNITALVRKIGSLRKRGKFREAKYLLPKERVYPLKSQIGQKIGIID